MGILDDAIKEHLELKRQHGADASALKQLEDEAFGAAERPGDGGTVPDPLAEAPTEFMAQPDLAQPPEAPPTADAAPEAPAAEPQSRPAPRAEIADLQEAPAAEHEIPAGPSTEEREAIAEQPTEMYDVEEELGPPPAAAPSEGEEHDEDDGDDEDDDFWDENRLSDELDQALEAPSDAEEERSVFEQDVEVDEEVEDEAEVEPEEPAPADQPPARKEEDVLEETPDFLEEAPEDDQLWFEQKPPKDFDFDD
jgi:hypothetical protein